MLPYFYQIKKALTYPDAAHDFVLRKVKEALFWDRCYAAIREPKVKSAVPFDNLCVHAEIIKKLRSNFSVIDFIIDLADYKKYINSANYSKYRAYFTGSRAKFLTEKCLEHYLAAKLLKLSTGDVYIDVASGDSPAPEIYQRLFGCRVYRQDLMFHGGINGNVIGGNACNMPVEDGFATKMALHCSFEHFEGHSDMKFIIETGRVLRKGGRLCILPLYLFDKYAIQTNPAALPKSGVTFEADAVLYCVKSWGCRYGRFYDVPHFLSRIVNNLDHLELTIYVIQNEKEVDPSCYVKFIALFKKV